MKSRTKNINGLLAALIFCTTLLVMSSCGDDDSEPEPVSPIVGTWVLDIIEDTDFPVGFTIYNGAFLPEDEGIESYEFVFNEDDTYTETIEVRGPNLNATGTYTYELDDLQLTPDEFVEGDITDYTVETINENELTLSFPVDFFVLPESILTDTTIVIETQQQFDSLFEASAVVVTARRLFYFEK